MPHRSRPDVRTPARSHDPDRRTTRPIRLAERTRAAVAARHGLVTKTELRLDGMSDGAIKALVVRDVLTPEQPGVYRVPGSNPSFESRCAAVCLAVRDAVITGPAAARLWGFRHVFEVSVPEVSTAAPNVRRASVHDRGPGRDAADVTERADGIRLTTPGRTWFDCARFMTDEKFELLTSWVVEHHALPNELHAVARRLDTRGRPGAGRVHRVLSYRSGWQRPAESDCEHKVVRALRRRGFTGLAGSDRIELLGGHLVHVTAADRSARWAVEVDHVGWHGGRFTPTRLRARDRRIREAGWEVVHTTDRDLRRNFRAVIWRLADSLTDRRQHDAA